MYAFICSFHNEDNLHTHRTSLNSDRGAPIKCHTAIALKHRYYVYIFLQWQNKTNIYKTWYKMYNDG